MWYRKAIYLLLGLGIFFGAFFGVEPGVLIDTALLTISVSPDVASNRGFFLFAAFYGYLSLIVVVLLVIATVLNRVIRKKKSDRQIRQMDFSDGKGTVDRIRLCKICGFTEEELQRLFPVSQDAFTFEEFVRARELAKSMGIKPCEDGSGLFRI